MFSAPRDELLKVHGIGPKTADRIVAAGELITRCVTEKIAAAPLDSEIRTIPVVMWLMRNAAPDSARALVLDKDCVLKRHRIFSPGEGIDAYRSFIAEAAGAGGKNIVFAHKHPGKDLRPSADDIKVTELLAAECRACGVELREHYVVNDTDASGTVNTAFGGRGSNGKEEK